MHYAAMAWFGSLLLMAGALFFQFGMGMEPCELCIYQRIPHTFVIIAGVFALWFAWRWSYPIFGLAMLIGAGIAFFHVGVEQHWWEGLQSCSGEMSMSMDELMAKPAARCDEIPWQLFSLSMAAWNGLVSIGLAMLWFLAWREA